MQEGKEEDEKKNWDGKEEDREDDGRNEERERDGGDNENRKNKEKEKRKKEYVDIWRLHDCFRCCGDVWNKCITGNGGRGCWRRDGYR